MGLLSSIGKSAERFMEGGGGSMAGKAGSLVSRGAKAAVGPNKTKMRTAGMGLLVGGAAVAGAIAGTKDVFKSAFDVAFDNPDADRAFTGQDFGPGFYASQAVGGPIGALGRAASPLGTAQGTAALGAGAVAGGAALAAGGTGLAIAGYGASKLLGSGGAAASGKLAKFFRGAAKGSKYGGELGAVLGVGAISAAAFGAKKLIDSQTSQSPYMNRNVNNPQGRQLNASGDIVLGMHNTRRGY